MDRLTLRIENRSDAAGDMPEDISVLGKGLSIGRKAANDWSLPDSTRFISGKHIAVSFEDDAYFLEDVSTNGTFVNGAPNRISGKHKLTDGDMIRIGSYIVAVLLEVVEDPVVPTISGAQGVQAPPMAARMAATSTGVQRNHATTASAQGAQKPDFSRFQAGGKGSTGVTGVQRPGGLSMPPISAPPTSANVIPDDFDDDLLGAAPAEVVQETPPTPKGNPAPPDAIPVEQVKPAVDPLPEPELKPMPVAPSPVAKTPTPPPPVAPVAAAPVVTPDAPFGAEDPAEQIPAPQAVNIPEPVAPSEPVRSSDGPFSMSDPTGVGAIPVVPPRETAGRPASVVEKTDMTPRGLGERFAETKAPRATPAPESAPPPVAAPAAAPPINPAPAAAPPINPAPAAAPPINAAPAAAPPISPAPTPMPPVAREPVSPPPETPVAAPAPIPAPAPEQPPVAAPPPEPVSNALLEGFLEGAGIDDPDTLSVPLHELGVMLGRCARLGTQEMMQMLQDRSAVKLFVAQEDRTMRIASGNNPMKFMMDPDDAFTALFVTPRDGYQTGPEGFDNALSDIRQHQQAMMAAIQPALADMLEGLAPTEISGDVGSGGGVLGSGARKSWEEYTKRWESRAAQGENGMLDAFIDAFSRRYNQALDSL